MGILGFQFGVPGADLVWVPGLPWLGLASPLGLEALWSLSARAVPVFRGPRALSVGAVLHLSGPFWANGSSLA